MLDVLSIRNILLIDALDLTFEAGLCVVSGETGAGKSILLNSLGLALGNRIQGEILRPGAEQGSVTAVFNLPLTHPVHEFLQAHEIGLSDSLILKRTLNKDGRSKAFINDQLVSVQLLREVSSQLLEIHGQFDQLLDEKSHLKFLDNFGQLTEDREEVQKSYHSYKKAQETLEKARQFQEAHRGNRDFLEHAVKELEELNPEAQEEEKLTTERTFLMNRTKIKESAYQAYQYLAGEKGVTPLLNQSYRALERAIPLAGGYFEPLASQLDHVLREVTEVSSHLEAYLSEEEEGDKRLEEIENRLFTLRALARKHGCELRDLKALKEKLSNELKALEGEGLHLEELEKNLRGARETYLEKARVLRGKRQKAAHDLNQLMAQELPPLKLEKATFRAELSEKDESHWAATGIDEISFKIQTNPGLPFGPLARIASGGERSRFMLALKVLLAREGYTTLLVFDEIESGVSGAVASALGERLSRLSQHVQVITITHSPQVACFARAHYVVHKEEVRGETLTRVRKLQGSEQTDEVARMLSGKNITPEARAAAEQLMRAAG